MPQRNCKYCNKILQYRQWCVQTMCQIIVHLCNYSEVEFRCLFRAHSTIPYNLCTSSFLIHFAQSVLKIISKSMRFGTPHSPNTFILAELISNEAQPVPVQTPQQPQHSFHASHPAGPQISVSVLETMTTTGNGCKSGASSRSAAANRWRGSDSESEPESPAPAAFVLGRGHVPLGKCVAWLVSVKLRRRRGRQRRRKRLKALDSYVLFTICSLSPFLKVRSDAVLDS